MTAPAWPSFDIHKRFGPDLTPPGGLDVKDIEAFARFALESFIGRIAMAFGGIDIAGWKPFDFLVDWGQARVDEATANYLAAINAQSSANYANAQLTVITGVGFASDVPGGVALNEVFNGPTSTTLGVNWSRTAAGSGAGTYGPNGSGVAVWNKSGGLQYTLFDCHNTPLTTDNQAVYMVLSKLPQEPDIFGGQAYNFLRARSNTANDTFVYARIGFNKLRVGCYVSGVETVFDTIDITPKPGDSWGLLVGTDIDSYEFIVKRNGAIVWRDIDTGMVSQIGSGFLNVGCAESANARLDFPLIFTQTVPGEMTAWAAADRLPASY